MGKLTSEALRAQIETNPVIAKYAKRISLLESARQVCGVKPMSTFEKYYAGQLFENIRKGNLYEGYTQPSNVGNFKRDAYNITSIAIQNTILPEIVSVQPMTTAAELLPILQIKYGTTKGSTNAGDVLIDSVGNGKTDKNYDGQNVVNAKIGESGDTTLTVVIPFTPVTPETVRVISGSTVNGTDDGSGAITGTGITSGTINYAAGTATITLAAAATEDVFMSYTYGNSNVPTPVGDVTMGINPVLIQAEEHKIKSIYALTAAYKLNKEYGVNMALEFEKQVANEMNKEKERIVIGDIFEKANGGNSIVWSSTPRPGVSDVEHVESLPIAINLAGATIYTRTNGNIQPNFIVAGSNVVAYLQKSKSFIANEAPANGGSFLAGTLGVYKVYQTPGIGSNDFFMGAVGNDFWQAGYIVGDYLPITFTTPVTLADYTTQQGWCSLYGNQMVAPNLYIRGRITN